MGKSQCRGGRMPLGRFWVQECTVYNLMRCIVQQLRVLHHTLDLVLQGLSWVNCCMRQRDYDIHWKTHFPANYEYLEGRGEASEDR